MVALLAPAPASAATAAGSLSGRLETTAGGPAVGVPVVASGDLDRHPDHVYRATTDADGRYRFDGVAVDGYDVGILADHTWLARRVGSERVTAGAAGVVDTATATRVAIVRGTLVSADDGSPIPGLRVTTTARVGTGLSVGAGVDVTEADGWLDVRRPLTLREGEQVDLGAVPAQPSGDVAIDLRGRSGHGIADARIDVAIDGCRLDPAYRKVCPNGAFLRGPRVLQVATGAHTVRFEVRNPVNDTVRRVTKHVVVQQNRTTELGVVRLQADPVRRVVVRPGRYGSRKPISVVVTSAAYTDDRTPHLRTTLIVNGERVVPVGRRYLRSADGISTRLEVTLPASWSTHRSLRVRAVVAGTTAYRGQTSAAVTLRRR